MKKIVVSAISFGNCGPLATLMECLAYLSANLADQYEIIALVSDERLFNFKNIKYYSFPFSKKSWFLRLYYEYIYFYFLSKKIKPYLWLSLHDTTPNVISDIRAVYALNPSPFCNYKASFNEIYWDFKFVLFTLFYRYLYSININKNDFIVVQQKCMKDSFLQLTGADAKKIIVAHPNLIVEKKTAALPEVKNTFIFPAFPRTSKNFEVVCRAAEILVRQGIEDFQILFTISGKENKYARCLFNSFKHIKQIKFLGLKNREEVYDLYNMASCVIFPSKLETWGLPVSEAKLYDKPLLLADLPYAHETLGAYDKVKFFDADNHMQLASAMQEIIFKTAVFEKTEDLVIPPPFARDWKELFDILLRHKTAKLVMSP